MPIRFKQAPWREIFLQPWMPIYLAGWIATTAWLAAVTMSFSSPRFTALVHGLNTLGFLVSLYLRYASEREQWDQLWRRVVHPSIFLRLLFFLFGVIPAFANLPGFQLLFPLEAYDVQELMIGALFVWGHLLYSFSMASDNLVLFAAVPGIAMFGLMSTINVNPSLLVAFLVFILGNLFLLGYGALLRHAQGPQGILSAARSLSPAQRLFRLTADQFITSVVLLGLTTGAAVAAAFVLQKVSPPIIPLALARLQLPDWYYQTHENYTGFLRSFRLGMGPVALNNEPVLRIRCDRELLYRGMTYDRYTGRSWEQTGLEVWEAPPLEGRPGFQISLNASALSELAPRPVVVQTIRTEKQMPSVLFGAAEPIEVAGPFSHLRQTGDGGIGVPQMVFKDSVYVVRSAIPDDFTPAQLQRAGTDYPPEIEARYRPELPFGAERIRELTQQVIAGATTPYERARAIQAYLEQNYVYGDAPRVPAGEDVASYFLFHSRQGVCDMFATAMVLMAREAGIPARLVTGFAAGRLDPDRQEYVVTGQDAHAWAELYFPGYGWIPFDPQAQRTAGLVTTLTTWFEEGRPVWRLFSGGSLFRAVLLGLILAWLYYFLRPYWRRRPLPPAPHDYRGQIVRLYHQTCTLLRRCGYPRQPGQTPREYLRALLGQAPLQGEPGSLLEEITAIFQVARYSRAPVTAADCQHVRHLTAALKRQLRRWKRGSRGKG